MSKKPLNITMEEDLVKKLKIQAVNEGTSASRIIEKLVSGYLEKQKQ